MTLRYHELVVNHVHVRTLNPITHFIAPEKADQPPLLVDVDTVSCMAYGHTGMDDVVLAAVAELKVKTHAAWERTCVTPLDAGRVAVVLRQRAEENSVANSNFQALQRAKREDAAAKERERQAEAAKARETLDEKRRVAQKAQDDAVTAEHMRKLTERQSQGLSFEEFKKAELKKAGAR